MVRRTCTAIAVLAQADTKLSPIGVTWGSAALIACSLRIGSQKPPLRHGPIVLRWPRKRAANATSNESKRRNRGGVRLEPGWSPPQWSFVRLLSHPNTKPTSAPTSTRDGPHVGTHICGETPYLLFQKCLNVLKFGPFFKFLDLFSS